MTSAICLVCSGPVVSLGGVTAKTKNSPLRSAMRCCNSTRGTVAGCRAATAYRGLARSGRPRAPRRAFATALAGTASNPLTIASWAALFAAASFAGAADGPGAGVLLVAGVALGSLAWCSGLAAATALARRSAGERALRIADALAGLGLIGFGGLLAIKAADD